MKDVEVLKKLFAQGLISRRDFLKQVSVWGISSTLAGSMLSSNALAQEAQFGGHFVMAGNGSSTDSLDPVTYNDFVNSQIGYSVYNRLVYQDPNGMLVPRLAISWDSNDSFDQWNIQLREGVEFHNGKTMTSADVLYSLQRHYGEGTTSGAAGNLSTIKDIKATGPYELNISLSSGDIDFMYLLTDYHLMIQPEGSIDDAIGTGAFILEHFEPGVMAMFRKNPNYWDAPKPYYDSYELLTINDLNARTTALQTGKVHAITNVDPKTVEFLRKSPSITINNTPSRGHYNFTVRTDTNPFDSPDLVLAMKYALPRQQIIDIALGGFGALGNDHPINAGYALFENGVAQRELDLDKARHHYERSGHSGVIELRVADISWPNAVDGALLFKESAAKIGMNIDIRREPSDGFWNDVWNVQPFYASNWFARATQDQMFTVAYTGDWNDTRFQNEEFSRLLQEARTEKDQSLRAGMYTRMQQLIHDHSGALIPVYNSHVDAIASSVTGYVGNPSRPLMDQLIQENTWFS